MEAGEWIALLAIVVTIIIAISGLIFTIWWRVESRQDRALHDLRQENGASHVELHGKIDSLRDQINDIWKYVNKREKENGYRP